MPTFYNDVDGKLEAVLKNLLTTQAATTGSYIKTVDIHTGLSKEDVTEDLIFGMVESTISSTKAASGPLWSTSPRTRPTCMNRPS